MNDFEIDADFSQMTGRHSCLASFRLGCNDLKRILGGVSPDAALLVCDELTEKYANCDDFLRQIQRLSLPRGEKAKNAASLAKILQSASDLRLRRDCCFVALGGGAICDLTAFAASIYMRGVRLALIPTTFLAQIDAAVGGKTAVDFAGQKNLLGTFYAADFVCVSADFLKDLPDGEFLNGIGEAAKMALLASDELFGILRDEKAAIFRRDEDMLSQIVRLCIKSKLEFAETDFADLGVRRFLNFGHTFGHALEAAANFAGISHGAAVAWGVSRAIEVSRDLELCSGDYRDEVIAFLSGLGFDVSPIPHGVSTLFSAADFGEKIVEKMQRDKKNTADGITLVLQRGFSRNLCREVPESVIRKVLAPERA